jgi:hypothetical protein
MWSGSARRPVGVSAAAALLAQQPAVDLVGACLRHALEVLHAARILIRQQLPFDEILEITGHRLVCALTGTQREPGSNVPSRASSARKPFPGEPVGVAAAECRQARNASSASRSSTARAMRPMNWSELSRGCISGAFGGWPSVPVHHASAPKSCCR